MKSRLQSTERRHPTVHSHVLPCNVLASIRSEEHRAALQILVVAQATERSVRSSLFANAVKSSICHLGREKPRAYRVYRNTVLPPLAGKSASEIDDSTFTCVIGKSIMPYRVPSKTSY